MNRLKNVKLRDILSIPLFLLSIIPAMIYRLYLRMTEQNFWLIAEENEAHDNAFVFFDYMLAQHPEQKVYYAINSKSPDYQKMIDSFPEELLISYGGLKHWIYYLCAATNISSQKGAKPNAAICYVLEVYGILKNHRTFLQHGVTLNNVDFLHYSQTKMSLFITSARPEFEFIKKNFGYPETSVVYTGMPRLDRLHQTHANKKKILLMPTWRSWLKLNGKDAVELVNERKNIASSDYIITYNRLIQNDRLLSFLEKHQLELYFYPHRNAQDFIQYFQSNSSNVILCSELDFDVQELLIDSSFLITDYSSVALDFIYMKKPVVFFQFDEEKFRKYQYSSSYFDYHQTNLGAFASDIDSVIDVLEDSFNNNFNVSQDFNIAYQNFFTLCDNHNSERVFQAIKESLQKESK